MYISRLRENPSDLVILSRNDTTYFSPDYIQMLSQRYAVDQTYSRLTVLRRIPPSQR
jgi:hypothetical protein